MLRSIRGRLGVKDSQVVELPEELSGCVTKYLDLKKRKSELDRQSKELEALMKSAYAPVQEALKGAEKGVLVLGDLRYQAGYTKRVTTSINKESMEAMGILYPDIYKEYAKTNVSRSFYIKQEKAG